MTPPVVGPSVPGGDSAGAAGQGSGIGSGRPGAGFPRADKPGQTEDKHRGAWSVYLDILGIELVRGSDRSEVISC